MKELEVTKQYLMLDPNKWLSECKAPGSSPSLGPRGWGCCAAGAGLRGPKPRAPPGRWGGGGQQRRSQDALARAPQHF